MPTLVEPMSSKSELEKLMSQLEKGLANDSRLEVRAPSALMDLMHKVAGRIGLSDASYIRVAIIEKLRRDMNHESD